MSHRVKNCTCYYFDDIIKVKNIDFDNIRFDEVYGVIKIYDGTRYLELFGSWFYHIIYDKIHKLNKYTYVV